MKNKLLIGVGVLVLLAGAVYAALNLPKNNISKNSPQALLPTSPEVDQDKGEAPHPLTRESIAGRSYPGSPITVERDLGEQGGFRSYVVSYRSDGFKINSLMNVPNGQKPAAGWPVLIFNHGYFPPREYQTISADYRVWTDGLARNGYIVFKPDYRGHAQSEGNSAGGNWSPDYAYDVLNLISSIKQYPQADGTRVGMFGHSMGGNVTMRTLAATTDVKAAVTLGGVVGSSEDLIYRWRRTPPRPTGTPGMFGGQRQRMVEEYGDPKANPTFWNSVSITGNVQHFTAPVQIHHGTADASVPHEFSQSLLQALQAAGKPVEHYEYPGGDHYFTGNGGLALQRMLALFNKHV